eukprot:m.105541 g.105541  ORF g.105541 m.105541 type:complete len:50 (-) comp15285_c0_seq3:1706-1855(-)
MLLWAFWNPRHHPVAYTTIIGNQTTQARHPVYFRLALFLGPQLTVGFSW